MPAVTRQGVVPRTTRATEGEIRCRVGARAADNGVVAVENAASPRSPRTTSSTWLLMF